MSDDPDVLVDIKLGPYTTGRFTACPRCHDTSPECETPGPALVWLARHNRDHHAPRPKDGNDGSQ